MKRCILALALVSALGTPAYAQPKIGGYVQPQTNPRPAISPYLNLQRDGTNAAIDYFALVRPQMETQQYLQSLQMSVSQLQNETTTTADPSAIGSGHSVTFFNYSHYFPATGSRFASGSAGAIYGGIGYRR